MAAVIDSKNIPLFSKIPGPKKHWLKGNLGQFDTTKVHDFFYGTAREYGGTAQIQIMRKKMVIVSKAETVKSILKERPDRFRRARVMETIFTEMGVHGIFSAEKEEWKKQRILLNPAFRPSQIKTFYPEIQSITKRLKKVIEQKRDALDIQNIFMSYTVDVTSSLAFGEDLNSLENPSIPLQENLNVIFPMISYRLRFPVPYWRWFKLKKDRDLDNAVDVVRKQVYEFFDHARMNIADNNKKCVDDASNILEAMLLTEDEHGNKFTEQELFGNVVNLLLAGEDTTANTLAWVIDYLVDDSELQESVYQEIQTHFPNDTEIAFDKLDKCTLINSIIHETMRLKPVAPHLYIEPINDEVVEGHLFPAGSTIVVLLDAEGFDEELFPQPNKFDPLRWQKISEENKKLYASKLMQFGYGPRLCPGRQLSLVEMKLALIELCRKFEFKRTKGTQPAEEVIKFTLQPLGLSVDAKVRSHA